MGGREFKKILSIPDANLPKNGLYDMAYSVLDEMDAASRRVISRFYLSWDMILSKAYTISTIQSGWRNIHFLPFNQEGILSNCPAYRRLTLEQKDDIALLMPKLIIRCLNKHQGCAHDEDIHVVMGEIIGHPNRHKEGIRPLETFDVGRSRAGFYTAPTMYEALKSRANYKQAMKAEAESQKKIKQTQQSILRAKKKSPAFKRYVNHKKTTECENCLEGLDNDNVRHGRAAKCNTCTRLYCLKEECVACYQDHAMKCYEKSAKIASTALQAAEDDLSGNLFLETQL